MTSARRWAGVVVCALALGTFAVVAMTRDAVSSKSAAVPVEARPSPVVCEATPELPAAVVPAVVAAPAPDSDVARLRTTLAALRERGGTERPSWQDLRAGVRPNGASGRARR